MIETVTNIIIVAAPLLSAIAGLLGTLVVLVRVFKKHERSMSHEIKVMREHIQYLELKVDQQKNDICDQNRLILSKLHQGAQRK